MGRWYSQRVYGMSYKTHRRVEEGMAVKFELLDKGVPERITLNVPQTDEDREAIPQCAEWDENSQSYTLPARTPLKGIPLAWLPEDFRNKLN